MLDREAQELIAGQLILQGARYKRKIMDVEAKQERPGEINAMMPTCVDEIIDAYNGVMVGCNETQLSVLTDYYREAMRKFGGGK